MGEHTKHSTSRVELRERIILAAVELFTTNGIKSITMDEIAASLGISKRTLYEVFPDKETLLEECILKSQKDGDIFVKGVIETSSNVLEVLLRCFRDDVNFAIINLLVRDQLDLLMNSDICNEYSFLEVYESIMFTFLRGISTEKGARVLEDFICEYRKNQVKPDETKE